MRRPRHSRIIASRAPRAVDPDGEDVQPVQRDGEERGEVRVLTVEVDGLAARGFLGGRQRRVDVHPDSGWLEIPAGLIALLGYAEADRICNRLDMD
ncbi:hypothetical protein V493_03688 [Pseudogymnoascus sp. VKM F-4281 (FW-2241)]|nr:hypothetical protein V493_03688 [Pseudogymnoascus sp. VKM F-4281 (FW-2241)]